MARETTLPVIYRGDDVAIPFIVYTTDTGTTAEDITGWTLVFTVAKAKNSSVKLISKAGTITSAAAGTWSATLAAADTSDLAPGQYFWDASRTDSGAKRLIGYGRFTLGDTARLPA